MADIIFDCAAVQAALDRMARAMQADEVALIGIERGGARVADALQQRLEAIGCSVSRGNLDISFYRDDLDTIGANPEVRPSHIPFDLNGRVLWLVDDVLYTGRTIRAALNEVFDYGRPDAVRLSVLLDRGGRELPIHADMTGLMHAADAGCSVKLITEEVGEESWHIVQRRVRP
ncbi:MAG: bifunctional pyr operon transcriptional regulator/uracil phosphoribosyltransferase PyrR [Mariprofundaceae bacterium]|nr:bifunctional pyr operon transcriptional regulator/uracil phosphoribosyltransferase PyrR [Mariprofundaceae bacterium]